MAKTSFEGLKELSKRYCDGEVTEREYLDQFVITLAEISRQDGAVRIEMEPLAQQMCK